MKPGGGKGKGGAFERETCRRLSLWVSDFRRLDVFWRSAMSGGRATNFRKRGRLAEVSGQQGDISAIHPLGHALISLFLIECKHRKELGIYRMIWGLKPEWRDMWEIPLEDARASRKEPIVIAKQNNRPVLIFTTKEGQDILCQGGKLPMLASFPKMEMRVFLFRDLLVNINYAKVCEAEQYPLIDISREPVLTKMKKLKGP